MALPTNTSINLLLKDICDEFDAPYSSTLRDFYRGGLYVPDINDNRSIPVRGTFDNPNDLMFSDFRGTSNAASVDLYFYGAADLTTSGGGLGGGSNHGPSGLHFTHGLGPQQARELTVGGHGGIAYATQNSHFTMYLQHHSYASSPFSKTFFNWIASANNSIRRYATDADEHGLMQGSDGTYYTYWRFLNADFFAPWQDNNTPAGFRMNVPINNTAI